MEKKIPVSWGNLEWFETPDSKLRSGDAISRDDPRWIDYSHVDWVSKDLSKEGHPERPWRLKLHQQIIGQILHGYTAPGHGRPLCVLTHGGIASGKTAAVELLKEPQDLRSSVHIDFDRVKAQLPENTYLNASDRDRAAPFVQAESSKIAGKTLKEAISRGLEIIYEGSLSDLSFMEEKIRHMKKAGYSVAVISTHVTEPKGQERALRRFKNGGRFVPPDIITRTFEQCPKTLVTLVRLVDYIFLLNNELDNRPARPILEIERGVTRVFDNALYADYLNSVGAEGNLN